MTAPTGLASGPAQIAAGAHQACVVLTNGPVECWGQDVGDGSALSTVHTSAVGIPSLPVGSVSQIAAAFGGCALVMLGGLSTNARCWGDNSSGELGDNTTTDRTSPVKVHGLSNLGSVTTGGRHACALLINGGARCWGANGNGQLGDGTTTDRHTPAAVQGLPLSIAQIAAGGTHTCALLTDGSVWCWGSGGKGQLGDGFTSDSSTPVEVTGLPARSRSRSAATCSAATPAAR